MIHTFLRSIGLQSVTSNEKLYEILEEIVNHPDEQSMAADEFSNEFACFSKFFGTDYGISVCGNFITESEFRMEYYYPFLRGSRITTKEKIDLERHASKESFAGICDDMKLGITLIFYVENIIDTLREKKMCGDNVVAQNAVLSGLSTNGKILLPVLNSNRKQKQTIAEKRMNLMQQARDGDRSAMENLTLNDMDTYSSLSKRIQKEDIFSIVESSFIPYGVESDQYVILGEIQSFFKEENQITGEGVWILSLLCNDMQFDVCINEKDLYGEPEVGRRFKGRVWMQGHLNFGY